MKSEISPYALEPRAYLARPAERLTLQGYRGWTWTVASRSPAPWREVCRLYRSDLKENAEMALQALSDFVETLGLCAACPLRMRGPEAHGLCRDEALVLALLAGLQHCDQAAIERSVSAICCPAKAEDVTCAAGIYAVTLRMLDRYLLPIPLQVVGRICSAETGLTPRPSGKPTLH